jgi:hypothetical protein
MRKAIRFLVVATHLLLFVSCAQGIYKLAGGKSPRVENPSTLQSFLREKDSLEVLHTYVHQFPIDTTKATISKMLDFDSAWTVRFFNKDGYALESIEEIDYAPFFANQLVSEDSLYKHFKISDDKRNHLDSALFSLATFDNKRPTANDFAGKYVVLIPWNKYAMYKDMREDVIETTKIIREKNIPLQIVLMNFDFQENWGLPLGKKIPGKYVWNKSERSIEATYNMMPLLKKSQ